MRKTSEDIRKQYQDKGYKSASFTFDSVTKWLRTKCVHINPIHVPHNQTYRYTISGAYQLGEQGVLQNHGFSNFKSFEEMSRDAVKNAIKFVDNRVEKIK